MRCRRDQVHPSVLDFKVEEYNGMFFKDTEQNPYAHRTIDSWCRRLKKRSDVEKVVNHIHVADYLLDTEIDAETFSKYGDYIFHIWISEFRKINPLFIVSKVDQCDLQLTFFLARELKDDEFNSPKRREKHAS